MKDKSVATITGPAPEKLLPRPIQRLLGRLENRLLPIYQRCGGQ
jgi:hypothetical protein